MIDGGEWESDNKMDIKGPLSAPPSSPPTPPSFLLYLQHVHDPLAHHLLSPGEGGPSIFVLDGWVGIVVEQQAHYLSMALK